MTSLREQDERLQAWQNERNWVNNDNQLRWPGNDHPRILFYFAGNGNDGDQFIKVYRSHVIDGVGKRKDGSTFPTTTHKYCPVQSGESGTDCPSCQAGHLVIKERMSIWLYVNNILHEVMPPDKAYPQVMVDNRVWFNEEVKDFRIWHTSAWKDSPWGMIKKLYELYNGLHNFMGQLEVTGDKLGRRYPLYAVPNTAPLDPNIYAQAKAVCEPIPNILKAQMGGPVVSNPNPGNYRNEPENPALVTPFTMPGQILPTFDPASSVPSIPANTLISSPPETVEIGNEIVDTVTDATPNVMEHNIQEDDNRRPMKGLF